MERHARRSESRSPWAARLAVVVAVAVIGAGCGETVGEATPAPAVDEEYRSLVARYLAGPLDGDARVRLRDLPRDADIPFPEEAILIGSVEQVLESGGTVVTALVEVPAIGPEDAPAAFIEAFEAAGWEARDIPVLPGSFAEEIRTAGGSYTALCLGEDRLATVLTLATGSRDRDDEAVTARITIGPNAIPTDLCGRPTFFGSTSGPILARFGQPDPFPILTAPVDGLADGPMVVASGLASASRSHTVTRTEASNAKLQAHYGAQLREALWVEVESGAYRGATWSLWRFQDRLGREWTAVLSILEQEAHMGVDRMLPELRVRVVTIEAIPMGHSMPQ